MELAHFQSIVDHTITTLPEQFQEALKSVMIVIEPRPRSGSRSLLGLYEGIPLTQWGRDYSGKIPDKITLYQENLELHAESEDALPAAIRITLLHEIAHYFGYDHDQIRKMEKRWNTPHEHA